ncbi:MAG: ABC transporter ATP-binding protein [Candidatus Thiodiazotropha sp.]|jgi:putative ABC transport system ATP-binding protein
MMEIRLDEVRKAYNQGRPNEYWAIRGISMRIEPKRVTCLKGASGSGKTTLLSMIGSLSRPTAGRIHLGDRLLSALPERFLTDIRRHTFGFIFQRFNLISGLSVLQNIILPAYPLAPNHKQLIETAHRLLEEYRLIDKADSRVEWLSGGEAQRVAICRALINGPEILVADEPTANLDSEHSRLFMQQMEQLRKAGKTVILSSHDPLVYDCALVDRVISLRDGLLEEG